MLYSITEKLKKRIYGRLERTLFGQREVKREVQESIDRRTKEFQSSTISKCDEKKIPDPWFN
jgi:hypothetical protein